MARPTILIGIGSGGLRSIEAAWKLSQEIPATINANQRPLVEFIYLETDGSNKAISSDIISCPLTLLDINASKHAVEQDLAVTSSWVHNQNFSDNVMNGAGGSPVVGRMTIWDKNNRTYFEGELNKAVGRLNQKSLEKPLVYIVGSFGGGTGSGTFLDFAYIVRDVLSNQVEVQGLFMIPNTGLADRVIYSNTVCCIKELEYYNDENNEFPFKWKANPPKGYEKQNTPFDLVQIISASYNTTLAPVSYSQLHEEAGLFLYLNMLGLYDVRRKSLVDASGNIIVSKYTTYGLAALHYPENEIKELLGNKLASELLHNITDDQNYYDKDTNSTKDIESLKPAIRNRITQRFETQFTEIVQKWCDTIEVVDGTSSMPVEMHIESIAKMLASGNSSYDEKRKTLYALFRVGGEYYKQLKNQCNSSARDAIVALVISEIREVLKDYQNLYAASEAIDTIKNRIEKILAYWEANGYQKDPEAWNTLLKRGIVDEIIPMPTTFKIQFEAKKVYQDRIRFQLLYGLAMHILSDSLKTILQAINGAQDQTGNRIIVKDTQGNELPSKYQIEEWKDLVKRVKSDPDPSYQSCEQTYEMLRTKLSNANNGNIEYLFPEGNLESTLKVIEGKYISNHNTQRSIEDVYNGNDDLYQFLLSIASSSRVGSVDAENDLYEKATKGYIADIDTGDFSVADAIKDGRQLERISRIVGKSKIPHLPINPIGRNAQFQDHKNIPHVLAGFDGSNGDVLGQIDQLLRNAHVQGFEIKDKDRNKLSHIGLNNWLIFYQEFGRMSDDRPFNIIDDLRDFQDYSMNYAADMKDSGMREQEYHEKRMPYLSYDLCRKMSQKYIQEAGLLYQNDEWENSVQKYNYAYYWDMSNPMPMNQVKNIEDRIQQEDNHHKFDRYMGIANRCFEKQDYQKARDFYGMADKIIPGDSDVRAQIGHIDAIAMKVNNLVTDGDNKCITANIDYDKCVHSNDKTIAPQCIQAYREIQALYEQALALYKYDENIKHKISSVNKRIQNLNNLK